MRYKLLFLMLFVMLALPLASSLCELQDADIGTFKQNSVVNLWQTCPDCSFVNITSIKYPNSSTILLQQIMTQQGTIYNYSFSSTNDLGDYVYTTFGNSSVNGLCTQNIHFKITPTGDNRGFSLVLILGIIGVVIFLFGWYTKNIWLVYIAGTLFLLLGVYTMIYGFNNINDIYTQAVALVAIGLGVLFTVAAIYEQVWGGELLEDD